VYSLDTLQTAEGTLWFTNEELPPKLKTRHQTQATAIGEITDLDMPQKFGAALTVNASRMEASIDSSSPKVRRLATSGLNKSNCLEAAAEPTCADVSA
jgi:hypothetical protein